MHSSELDLSATEEQIQAQIDTLTRASRKVRHKRDSS